MKTIGLLALGSNQAKAFQKALGREVALRTTLIEEAALRAEQAAQGWPGAAEMIKQAAGKLLAAGAGVLLLTSLPGHKVCEFLPPELTARLAHPGRAAARYARRNDLGGLLLLASRFSCYDGFFRRAFQQAGGGRLILPEPADVELAQSLLGPAGPDRLSGDEAGELERVMATARDLGAGAALLGDIRLVELLEDRDWPLETVNLVDLQAGLALEMT